MNLYQKMTPARREQVQKEVAKYPSTGRLIMSSLEDNDMVATLTIREAYDIYSIFYPIEPFNLSNLYKLFS